MRRINDEESIRKLVIDVFHGLWFSPSSSALVRNKVVQITETIRQSVETGFDGFENLLNVVSLVVLFFLVI